MRFFAALLLLLMLSACAPGAAQPAAPAATFTSAAPAEKIQITYAPDATLTPTAAPSPTATKLPYPVITEPEKYQEGPNFISQAPDLHNVILFYSEGSQIPFAGASEDTILPGAETGHEWAISTDGQRRGLLTLPGKDQTAYYPRKDGLKPIIATLGLKIDEEVLYPLYAVECYLPEGTPFCGQYAISPSGRYVSMQYGPESCGRGFLIYDLTTRLIVYDKAKSNHWAVFLPDDRVMLAFGHCEGGTVSLVNLKTGKETKGGEQGDYVFNADHSAVAFETGDLMSNVFWIWGFNLKTNQPFFIDKDNRNSFNNQFAWSPTGQLLYRHQDIVNDFQNSQFTFNKPSQILAYDVQTGKSQVVLSDPAYSYYLCADTYRQCDKETPPGKIWVQRQPFEPKTYENPSEIPDCIRMAEGCQAKPEHFLYDPATKELTPFTPPDHAVPQPLVPDLSDTPLYQHPSGEYALYLDKQGSSLWMVPKGGEPILWVKQGSNFMYVP